MNYVGGQARKPELSLHLRVLTQKDFVTLFFMSRTLKRAVERVHTYPYNI